MSSGFCRGFAPQEVKEVEKLRKLVPAFAITLVVMALVAGMAMAQQDLDVRGVPENDVYVVQHGDTLWDLSAVHARDPKKWEALVQWNPWLVTERRITYKRGEPFVRIYPREKIVGLRTLDITPPSSPTVIPLNPPGSDGPVPPPPAQAQADWMWLWWLLLVPLAFVIYLVARIFRDPATSGVPMVEGGVSPDLPDAVANRFERMAERRYASMDPNANLAVARPSRIGPIEEGTLTGFGGVTFGNSQTEMRRLHNEPAFRALFRFPNGTEETLFFLQRCANDVTYLNARYHGFTFTPGRQVLPAPSPQPLHEVAMGTTGRPVDADRTTFTFNGIEVSMSREASVRMEHGIARITVGGPCEITFRREVKATKPRRAQAPTAATGTGGPATA